MDSKGKKQDEVTSASHSPSNLSNMSGATGGASVFVHEFRDAQNEQYSINQSPKLAQFGASLIKEEIPCAKNQLLS